MQRYSSLRPCVACLFVASAHFAAPSHAQTAPVFEAPVASTPTASGALLLRDALDSGPNAEADFKTSSASGRVAWSQEAGASNERALRFDYTLSPADDAPWASLPVSAPLLSGARGVRVKLKTSVPSAVSIWFETDGAPAEVLRYTATVWSSGGAWQSFDIDAARFRLEPADDKIATWNAGWARITRWGVQDSTNVWSARAGQTRASGARSLWADDLEISTRPASNAVQPAPVAAPRPLPLPPPQQPNNDGGEGEDNNPEGAARPQRMPQGENGQGDGPQNFGGEFFDQGPRQDGEGDGEEEEPEGDELQQAEQQAREQAQATQMIVQDAWGAGDLWIPFNSEVSALVGAGQGLKWSFVRLANRDSTLLSPVNGLWLRDLPAYALQRTPRDPRVAFRVQDERLVSLAIDLATTRATRLSVAVHERGGAIYSTVIALDPKRRKHRQTIALADLKLEGAARDANGQLDLAQIEAIALTDAGAGRGLSGPNDITLHGAAWIY